MSKMKFLKSAVKPADYPAANRPEIAVAGRSNAGKSSLLNCIAGAKVAMVSQQPGKTRLLNFFDFGKYYRWVDMPGYGYAARPGSEMEEWHPMIETFLATRESLCGLILLMDLRRDWEEEEELLKQFCNKFDLPLVLALTKIDKCKPSEQKQRLQQIRHQSAVENIFLISSEKKIGVKDLEDFIFNSLIKDFKESLS